MSIRESRFGRLTDHFFAGFLDNDLLISSGGGMQNLLSQAIGLLAAPGLFWCLLMSMKYGGTRYPMREIMAWDDRLLFVHGTMILIGLLTVLEWDALFPDRRDYQVLMPLPVPGRLVFLARLCSVLLLLTALWAGATAGTALLFPMIALRAGDTMFTLARHVVAHITATFAAGAFIFLFLASVQGLLMNLLPPKWFRRASVYAQLGATVALVLSFLLMPVLVSQAGRWIMGNQPWMYVAPSFWFLGLYQVLAGRGGPVFDPLAGVALKSLCGAAAAFALLYVASYRRHVGRLLDSPDGGRREPGFLARAAEGALNLFVLRHPLERAHFYFIGATLLRSRVHRLILAGCYGVGFALAVALLAIFGRQAAAGPPAPGLLAVQAILSFLVLCGIRFAFTLPAELQANWLFQAADSHAKSRCRAGARKAMLAFGAWPVLIGLLPLHVFFWGWQAAAVHLLFGAVLAILLVELLLAGFDKIPFTCTYLPGKAKVQGLWPVYLAAFWAYGYGLAKLESDLTAHPARLLLIYAAALAGVAALRWYGNRRMGPAFAFVFEDAPEPAVHTLGIAHGSRRDGGGEPPTPTPPLDDPRPFQPEAAVDPPLGSVLAEFCRATARDFAQDLRYARRTLLRNRGFTFTAVCILALAIGANTLLFTFFSAYVLKPLPIKDPQRNVELTGRERSHRPHDAWSYTDFTQLRGPGGPFEELYATSAAEVAVREPAPRNLRVTLVSGNYFRIFAGGIVLGRDISPEEDAVPGRDAVVVLSHHAWHGVFRGDPAIVGKAMRIGRRAYTIIGVTGPAFSGSEPITPDLWAPLAMRDELMPAANRLADPENACLRVAGLLRPDVSLPQAHASVLATVRGLNAQHPPALAVDSIRLKPRPTYIPLVDEVLVAAISLFGAFGLVLLAACANVAGILLARGAARTREMAVRGSLGASRGRLIRQLLTESVLLAAMAAACSLALTVTCTGAAQRFLCTWMTLEGIYVQPVSPDWRTFAFTAAVALATGVLLGLAPALETTRRDLTASLKEAGAAFGRGSRLPRLREWLVIAQVAASFALLVVAGVFLRNAQRVARLEPGFDIDHVIDVRPGGSSPRLIERLRADPRIQAASEVYRTPVRGHMFGLPASVERKGQVLGFNYVDSGYFDVTGLAVTRGRTFTAQEARAQTPVVVVSAATARLLWPRRDALGETIQIIPPQGGERWVAGTYQVIGVVPDVGSGVLVDGRDRTAVYLPALPGDPRNRGLMLRSRDTSRAMLDSIRRVCTEVEGVNACEPVTLGEVAERQRFPHVAASMASSVLGGLALFMACLGLYGVVAFAVVRRTREIGVRMALGATPASVRSLIARQMLRPVVLGIALGLPVCLGFSQLAARVLYTSAAVRTFDPWAYVVTPLVLAVAALAAAYIPARRATRIDPMGALRQE